MIPYKFKDEYKDKKIALAKPRVLIDNDFIVNKGNWKTIEAHLEIFAKYLLREDGSELVKKVTAKKKEPQEKK